MHCPMLHWLPWRHITAHFTQETLVAIEELTEQLWRTPYATRIDSISNYTHSEGLKTSWLLGRLSTKPVP